MTSGIKVTDVEVGAGASADRTKVVVVHIRAFLNRGDEFWNTHTEGRPAILDLSKRHSIPGLIQGVEGMRVGGKRQLVVSPHLAYGPNGVPGKIPANAVIRFEVELLDVREPDALHPELYPAGKQLLVFRPGEAQRNLARWQFGIWEEKPVGGVTITHPVAVMTWRHAIQMSFEINLTSEQVRELFESVSSTFANHPAECLRNEQMRADTSEQANNVTRDQTTNTLCVTVHVYERGASVLAYGLPENNPVLLNSRFYQVIVAAVEPHIKAVAHELNASSAARRQAGVRLP